MSDKYYPDGYCAEKPVVTASVKTGKLACALLLFVSMALPAADSGFLLDSETWARPRSGSSVSAMPVVRQLVQQWVSAPTQRIDIRYPGGEEGVLWASELRDWLVALGIPAEAIIVQAGSPHADQLLLQLTAP